MPPTLKNLLGTEGVPFFTPSPTHPRPHGPPLFFFVHLSFFSESQINSLFDVRRLPPRSRRSSSLAGTADGRARLPQTPCSVHAVPTRGYFPVETTTPSPQLLTESRGQGSEIGNAVAAWPHHGPGAPSSDPVSSACPRQCHRVGGNPRSGACASLWASRPPASTPREAKTLIRPRALLSYPAAAPPGLPARSNRPLDNRGQFARTAIASTSGARGYVRADGPGGRGPREAGKLEGQRPKAHGHRRVGGPRWAPGPSHPASPRTRTHPGAVGGPRIYIFSSLGAGVRFCILMRS